MGLDTYARNSNDELGQLTDEQTKSFQDAGIKLCGGMFSGNGNDGSFRGKVYNGIVQEATGQSLYEEWIEPDTVANMRERFEEYLEDVENITKFLRVCADNGLGLVGWW